MTEEQRKILIELSRPLMSWLNENYNPHVKLHISCDDIELVELQTFIIPESVG